MSKPLFIDNFAGGRSLFEATVIETRAFPVTYIVEADNEDEACELMAKGDTVSENDLAIGEVTNRVVGTIRKWSNDDQGQDCQEA